MKIWALICLLLLVGCGNSVESEKVVDGVYFVTYDEMMALAKEEDVVIVDVRTRVEYDAGHIEGSILIPHDQVVYRLSELEDYQKLVLYCGTTKRALEAYEDIKDSFQVYIFEGGYNTCAKC